MPEGRESAIAGQPTSDAEERAEPAALRPADNSHLYLWLFLGVPGAFVGARQAFKRDDRAVGKRLVGLGVVLMIGFCLFLGFIMWRTNDTSRELAHEPSAAGMPERVTGGANIAPSVPPTATIPQGAAYAMLHPSIPGAPGDLGRATAIIKSRLDGLGIDGVAQCLGNDVLVVTNLESGIRRAESGGVFQDLPSGLRVESVQTFPPPTEGQHIGCE